MRTGLFISNGQQFAHLSAHTAQYTNITLLLPISPFNITLLYIYISSF